MALVKPYTLIEVKEFKVMYENEVIGAVKGTDSHCIACHKDGTSICWCESYDEAASVVWHDYIEN